jgi:SAM-dependent methyltransferase
MNRHKGFLRRVFLDFVFAPFRFTGISESWSILRKLGLTTLEEERVKAILPYTSGRLLDIGCGNNLLTKEYDPEGKSGVGVDVYDYGGGAMIVDNSSALPFPDSSFDTIVFAANLNHIPYRLDTLKEAYRLIKNGGKVIITMINPLIGFLIHKVWELRKQGLDYQRGMQEDELYGLWSAQVIELSKAAGFHLLKHTRFDYGFNHLYVFRKQ